MNRIIDPRCLRAYAKRYPTAEPSLMHWLETTRRAGWQTPADVKANFNSVDAVRVKSGKTVYVFNIERNRHRLVAAIHFNTSKVFILRLMTHREYDSNQWKDEL